MDRGSFRLAGRLCVIGHLSRSVFVLSVTFVASCGGGASNAPTGPLAATPVLAAIRVTLSSDTLLVGQSATASASGVDQNGAAIGIGAPIWSTASPGVASVSASGVVSAVAPGHTTLTAAISGKQGQVSLTVVQIPIARVSITPASARVAPGATVRLTATALDFNGHPLPGRKIDWATSNAALATVTSTGVVTAVAPGVATISATSEGISASAVVTVTNAVDSVATLTLSPGAWRLTVGGSVQLAASLKDGAGNILTGRTPTWSATVVAGANVATVSATGMVTAVAPGMVIIEAFSEGQHGAATITVVADVDKGIVVTFAAPVDSELVGDTLRVSLGVKSISPLANVVAQVGPIRTTLVLTRAGALGLSQLWVGMMDLTDLPSGPYQLIVTATDIRGAFGVGVRAFLRDNRKNKGGSGDTPKMK